MIWNLFLGGLAGFLAGKVMKGEGYGLLIDIVLGLVGGVVGGWLGSIIGIHLYGSIGYLLTAFAGAVALVWVVRKL